MEAIVVTNPELLELIRAEIRTILPRLTSVARRVCRGSEDPEECVNQAILLVAAGKRSMSRETYEDVFSFLCGVVGSVISHRRTSAWAKRRFRGEFDPDDVPESSRDPESLKIAMQLREARVALFTAIRKELAGDALALKIFNADEFEPIKAQAKRFRVSDKEIENARKRIRYVVEVKLGITEAPK